MLTVDRMEKARKSPNYDLQRMAITHMEAMKSLRYACDYICSTADRLTVGNMAHHKLSIRMQAKTIQSYIDIIEQDMRTIGGVQDE